MSKGTAAQRCRCEGGSGWHLPAVRALLVSFTLSSLKVKAFTKVSLPALPSHGGQEIKETLNGTAELGNQGC